MPFSALTTLMNLLLTQQGSGDTITGAELRQFVQALMDTLSKTVTYTTAIPFNRLTSYLGQQSLTTNATYTRDVTDATAGSGTILRLVGDGSHAPVLTNFKKTSLSADFDSTSGALNVLLFFFDGADYWVTIYQDAAGGAAGTVLTAPVIAAAAASSTQINVTWSDVANESSYLLEVSTNGGSTWSTLATPAANATSYNHTGLSTGVTRHYRLTAIGNGTTYLDSAVSNTASASTSSVTQLTAPTLVATPASTTQINLTWGDVANESSYLLEVSSNGGSTWSTLTSPAANAVSYNHTGLTAGVTRHYRLKAIGNGSTYTDSNYSTTVSATTNSLTQLTAPTVSVGSVTSTGFQLTWGAITNANQYEVEISTDSGFATIVGSSTASALNYTFSSGSPGTTYYYRVRAKDTTSTYTTSNWSTGSQTLTASGDPALVFDDVDSAVVLTSGSYSAPSSNSFGQGRCVRTTGFPGDFEMYATLTNAVTAAGSFLFFGVSDAAAKCTYNTGMKAVFYLEDGDANYKFFDSGSQSSSSTAKTASHKLKVYRVGSVLKAAYSSDGGSTWTDIKTFTYSSSGTLYPVADMGQATILGTPKYIS